MKKLLTIAIILITILNSFGQSKPLFLTADKNGNIISTGKIEIKNRPNFDIFKCVKTFIFVGVESTSESIENKVDTFFVKGAYSYTYYVQDTVFAGEIKFKYEYIIKNRTIEYNIYDFEHIQSNSKFGSVGIIPLIWNEKVKKSFTEAQYSEIMKYVNANVALAIRMLNNYCVK